MLPTPTVAIGIIYQKKNRNCLLIHPNNLLLPNLELRGDCEFPGYPNC